MFVSNLNNEQQSYLLSLGEMLIKADNQETEKELEKLNILREQLINVPKKEDVQLNKLSLVFTCQKSKVSLLLELLGIAHADEEYHETEQDLIAKIAKYLNISTPLLFDMNNWVKRELILANEAQIFMEEK